MTKYKYHPYDAKWTDGPNHVPPGNAAPRHVGYDLRDIVVLERVQKRTQQPPRRDWVASVIIALLMVAVLILGLSLDVQATVDAVNGGL